MRAQKASKNLLSAIKPTRRYMSNLTRISKPVIIATLVAGAIAGVSFAAQPQTEQSVASLPIAAVEAPATQPSNSSESQPEAAQEAVQTPSNSGAASVSAPTPEAPTQPTATAPAAAPVTVEPAAPVTLVQVVGSGVTSMARPYIDSFTCTYQFSDGTSQSRPVVYGKDELDHAAAVCPSWE